MAYLDFVRSAGKTYVYVNEYVGKQSASSKYEKRIARLGRSEQALMQLKIWLIDQKKIPESIDPKDYKRIPDWIEAVRNRGAY